MEYIKIVDKNGNDTGEILEKEIAHDRNLLHNEISIYVINAKKEILLQKRSLNKRFNPGKWGACSGHVEATETLKEAALRELNEELGLKVDEKKLISFFQREIVIKEKNSHITYFYCIYSNLSEQYYKIQPEELSEVKYFSIDTVIKHIKENSNKFTFDDNRIKLLEEVRKIDFAI
ncbi:MAG: NUDIX domain-containing protein [Mycoplasmatota bacterium]